MRLTKAVIKKWITELGPDKFYALMWVYAGLPKRSLLETIDESVVESLLDDGYLHRVRGRLILGEKASSLRRPKGDPRIASLTKLWTKLFIRRYGIRPAPKHYGRVGQAFKRVLAHADTLGMSEEEALEAVSRALEGYFADDNRFLRMNFHPVGQFENTWPKYANLIEGEEHGKDQSEKDSRSHRTGEPAESGYFGPSRVDL